MSLKQTQAPFRMVLIPSTVDVAETVYNLTDFLSLDEIGEDQKAESGELCVHISCLHKGYTLRV